MKKYSMMMLQHDEDSDSNVYILYTFNKKRLFKILQKELGVNNPKKFLKEEYTSEDTANVIEEFIFRGWSFESDMGIGV